MHKIKAVLLSVLWTVTMLIFPVSSGIIVSVLEMSQIPILLTQGSFMLASLVVPFMYIRNKKISFKNFGLRPMEKQRKIKNLFLPLVLAELPLIVTGVDFVGFTYIISLAFFAIAVGVSEEVYFRGIILKLLENSFTVKKAIAISALIFGVGHFASVLSADNIAAVLLQVINAIVFGVIAAEIVVITKGLFPVIIWHFLFNFVNRITPGHGTNFIAAIAIQEVILIAYAVFLWRVITDRKEDEPLGN